MKLEEEKNECSEIPPESENLRHGMSRKDESQCYSAGVASTGCWRQMPE